MADVLLRECSRVYALCYLYGVGLCRSAVLCHDGECCCHCLPGLWCRDGVCVRAVRCRSADCLDACKVGRGDGYGVESLCGVVWHAHGVRSCRENLSAVDGECCCRVVALLVPHRVATFARVTATLTRLGYLYALYVEASGGGVCKAYVLLWR